ncbi:unnamed protein product [Orchesella dallaii]|uniref:MATH domain-containing protein n=1 Tax=Orchesella dallaii TaxID=48710 RepID=A0ABP1QNQ9_9HEXA
MTGRRANPAKRRKLVPEIVTSLGETVIEKENFSDLRELPMSMSPIFHGGPKNNHGWEIFIRPKLHVEGYEFLGLYLQINDGRNETDSADIVVKATAQFNLLNADGHAVRTLRLSGSKQIALKLHHKVHLNLICPKTVVMHSCLQLLDSMSH